MANTGFGARLELMLKVFSMSRAQLAAAVGVDKSLVARWAAGAVTPTAHNLANLSRYVAGRIDGFTMLDWERDLDAFAALLGAGPAARANGTAIAGAEGFPLPIMDAIRAGTTERAADLECFFRTTRPAEVAPGRFLHDQGMLRLAPNGLLEVRMGVRATVYQGWLFPVHGQLFCIATDALSGSLVFAIFSIPPAGRVQRLDGVTLGGSSGSLPGIAAAPIVLDRIGELSGDADADERHYRQLLMADPLAPEGSIPPEVLAQLSRDFGPTQLAAGGDWLLQIPFHRSLGRSAPA